MATYGYNTDSPFEDKKAIIFNNSGSMMADGRMEYVFNLIRNQTYQKPADIYINDASGRMRLVAQNYTSNTSFIGSSNNLIPILPLANGDDGWNPYVLAGVIDLYTEIHIIDDGESLFRPLTNSLWILKDHKEPSYMHDVNIHIIRKPEEASSIEAHYESMIERLKYESEGMNVTVHFHFASGHPPGYWRK